MKDNNIDEQSLSAFPVESVPEIKYKFQTYKIQF